MKRIYMSSDTLAEAFALVSLMTIDEAAYSLGVTRQSLQRWRYEGRVPAKHSQSFRKLKSDVIQKIKRHNERLGGRTVLADIADVIEHYKMPASFIEEKAAFTRDDMREFKAWIQSRTKPTTQASVAIRARAYNIPRAYSYIILQRMGVRRTVEGKGRASVTTWHFGETS